jgi:GNAT superfamily N-acetyltransferase
MADVLVDFSKASMAHAVEANLFSFFHHLAIWPRVEVHDDDECRWTISDLKYPLFNSVMRASVDDEGADRLIAARMDACRLRGVPMLWWTGPSTAPSDLGDRLLRIGFFLEPAYGMAADLHAAGDATSETTVGGLAIERVRDHAALREWSRVLCDAFGAPPSFGDAFAAMADGIGLDDSSAFRHYLALLGGVPVATSSLFLGAGVAGIYDVSTLPERRRRGIGAAITRFAMSDARDAGYRMAILHASNLGVGMYRSLGFEELCDIGQYVWVPEGFSRT